MSDQTGQASFCWNRVSVHSKHVRLPFRWKPWMLTKGWNPVFSICICFLQTMGGSSAVQVFQLSDSSSSRSNPIVDEDIIINGAFWHFLVLMNIDTLQRRQIVYHGQLEAYYEALFRLAARGHYIVRSFLNFKGLDECSVIYCASCVHVGPDRVGPETPVTPMRGSSSCPCWGYTGNHILLDPGPGWTLCLSVSRWLTRLCFHTIHTPHLFPFQETIVRLKKTNQPPTTSIWSWYWPLLCQGNFSDNQIEVQFLGVLILTV